MVRRHRATVRAGDFELYKFLVELGLVNQAGVGIDRQAIEKPVEGQIR